MANRQLVLVLFIMRSTVIIAYLPVLTSADALQDAWMSAVFAMAGTLLLVLLIALLARRFPEKTVVEYSRDLLGPVGGRVLSLVLLWAFLHLAAIDLRLYAEVVSVGFLPETPISFLTSVMVVTAAIAVYSGLEVIGRMADLIFVLFTVFVLLSLIAPLISFRAEFLEPVLSRGLLPPLRGSLVPVAVASQYLVLGVLYPCINEPEKGIQSSLLAVTASSALLIMAAVVVVGVMSAPVGVESTFPFFRMVRTIRVSEIIPHTEILTVVAWGFGLFVTVAVYLYAGAKGLSQVLSLSTYRPLILPMSAIWVVLSIHGFENVFEIRGFLTPQVMGVYGLGLVLVPYTFLYLGWGIHALRRGGNRHER